MNYPPYYPAPYTPMQTYPVRPDMQLYPQQPSQQALQGPQATPQTTQGLSPASRPVTNRDEANAVSADFSGALMVFPDITNSRVYIKRWNIQAGAAEFMEFVPAPHVPSAYERPQDVAFASLQDLQNLQELVEDLQKEINRMKRPVGKAAKANEQSDEK